MTWPAYFAPRDLAASQVLSRELHAVVSTVATTDDEGWSHTLFGCGTVLDRFHSYPAGLAWDDDDVAALAAEWSGDFELVARVFGVPACGVRRHFCQATAATRDHPGRDRDGYLGLWSALGHQGRRTRRRTPCSPSTLRGSGACLRVTAPSAGAPRDARCWAGSETNGRRPGAGSRPTMSITSKYGCGSGRSAACTSRRTGRPPRSRA